MKTFYEVVGELVIDYGFEVRRDIPYDGISVRYCGYEVLVSRQLIDCAKGDMVSYIVGALEEAMFKNVRKVDA